MKYWIIPLLALAAVPAQADEAERQEIYSSFLYCAAFHTIESGKTSGDAAAAHSAAADDYAKAATAFSEDGNADSVDGELKTLLQDFKGKLDNGAPREMAEQWTALESACRELHPVKDGLLEKRKAETEKAAEAR